MSSGPFSIDAAQIIKLLLGKFEGLLLLNLTLSGKVSAKLRLF